MKKSTRKDGTEKGITKGEQKTKNSPRKTVISSRMEDLPKELDMYRSLLECSNDAILAVELPSGKILDGNSFACDMLGISYKNLRSSSLKRFINNSAWNRIQGFLKDDSRFISKSIELRAVLRTDEELNRPVKLKFGLHGAEESNYGMAIMREQYSRNLDKIHSDAILQTAMDGFIIMDLRGKILEVNDAFSEITGYTRKELLEMNLVDLDARETPDDVATHLRYIIQNGMHKFETIHHHKDGHVIDIEVSAQFTDIDGGRIFSFLRDITDKKRAASELKQNEATLRSIFKAAPTGIGMVVNRTIVQANDRLCEMTGYSREELLGENARFVYLSDEDYEYAGREKYRQINLYGTGTVETRFRKKDGSIIDVLLSSTPLDQDNLELGVTFTALDITERKRAEAELEDRLKFETLISKLSAAFVNLPSLEVDDEINAWLQRIGEFLDVDRGTVYLISDDQMSSRVSHSWAASDLNKPYPENPDAEFPWAKEKVRRGETVIFSRIDDLPKEAKKEKQYFHKYGPQSAITIPLEIGGSSLGAVSFASMRRERIWPADLTRRIRIIGEIFANAIKRRNTEEALREERDLVSRLMETSPVGIAVVDRNGIISFANKHAEIILGLTRDKIKGRTYNDPEWKITDFCGNPFPDEKLPFSIVIKTAKPAYGIEHAIQWPDGRRRLLSINAAPLLDRNGRVDKMITSIEDITERRIAEEELQKREEQFEHAIRGSNAGDWDLRFDPDGVNGTLPDNIYISPRLKAMIGFEDLELPNSVEAWRERIIPEDLERLKQKSKEHLKGDSDLYEVEYRIRHKDGSIRWMYSRGRITRDEKGTLLRWSGIDWDITDRKHAEEALIESENKYRLLVENQTDLVVTIDSEFRLQYISPTYCKAFGKSEKELLGRKFLPLVHENDREKVIGSLKRVFKPPYTTQHEERALTVDGWRWFNWSAKGLVSEEGEVERIISVGRDITKQKEIEEDLIESESKYRTLFESASDAIFIMDKGRFIDCNAKSCDLFGVGQDQIINNTPAGFSPEFQEDGTPSKESALQKLNAAGKGEPQYFEWVHQRPDGSLFNVEVSLNIIELGGAKRIMAIVRDVTDRKQAEETIKVSEDRFRTMITHTSDAVFCYEYDPPISLDLSIEEQIKIMYRGVLAECNDVCARSYGFSRAEEVIGRSLTENFGTTPGSLDATFRDFIENGFKMQDQEGIEILEDGTERIFLNSTHGVIEDGKLLRVWGTFRDITEQKKAQDALRQRDATIKSIFAAAPIGIGMAKDRIIIQGNDLFATIAGYEKDDLIGKDTRMLYQSQAEYDRVGRELYEQIAKYGVGAVETIFKHKDGTNINILLRGTPLDINDLSAGTIVTALDITDRKLAEESLASEKEQLSVTLRSIGDGVITTDTEENIVLINKVAENITGWSEPEAQAKPLKAIFRIIDKETRQPKLDLIEKALTDKMPVELTEKTILLSKTGCERLIACKAAPIRDKDFNVIGIVLVFRDITERTRLQEFVSRAQRLETAGRIAAQVAHDFNNMLAPLRSYPELIRDELPSDHEVVQYADEIEKAADLMTEINQQLLTLGRRGHYSLENVNLNKMIEQILTQTTPKRHDFKVKTDLHPELISVNIGRAQIYRAIHNTITNACDAMSDGGTLTVRSENFHTDNPVGRLFHIPAGEYVRITISDTGDGIDPEVLPKIFDPFFTTKMTDRKRGSGLGLSVVHAVMEDHKGFVDCETMVGKGTSFYLYFPVPRKGIEMPASDHILGGHEKVLVIDDDRVQIEIATRILKKLGYQITSKNSGEEALEFLRDNPQDILIIDFEMPGGIDGLETFKRALKINPNQKAIIASGRIYNGKADYLLEQGVDACVRKPVTIKSLARAVRETLDKK